MVSTLISSLWRTDAPGHPGSSSEDLVAAPTAPTPQSRAAVARTRTGLRAALFEAVKPTHERVSEHAFFGTLKDKTLTAPRLASYLADQDHVIGALQTALLMRADAPALTPMVDLRVLNREGLAASDAAALGFIEMPSPTPAACRLAAHIGQLGRVAEPAGLAVHAWVQYNAMLNGGQHTAHALRKLFPQTPMSVFVFNPPAAQLRNTYANTINDIDCGDHSIESLCDEAKMAFAANAEMLDDVMARREGDIASLFDAIPQAR